MITDAAPWLTDKKATLVYSMPHRLWCHDLMETYFVKVLPSTETRKRIETLL